MEHTLTALQTTLMIFTALGLFFAPLIIAIRLEHQGYIFWANFFGFGWIFAMIFTIVRFTTK